MCLVPIVLRYFKFLLSVCKVLLVLLPILRPLVLARDCHPWDSSKVRCSGRTSRYVRACRRNRWRKRHLWEMGRRR